MVDFQAIAEKVVVQGPDRVVVDEHGKAVNPRRAFHEYGIVPFVVFVRNDGWTLGAPEKLEPIAFAMWASDWVGFIQWPSPRLRPMTEYSQRK